MKKKLIDQAAADALRHLEGLSDLDLAVVTIDLSNRIRDDLADIRAGAVRRLIAEGWSHRQVAKAIGVSYGRITQLLNR